LDPYGSRSVSKPEKRIRILEKDTDPDGYGIGLATLDLKGERDHDLADLVVDVVDVEYFAVEVDGGRAARGGRQHVGVVVGQGESVQHLTAGPKFNF